MRVRDFHVGFLSTYGVPATAPMAYMKEKLVSVSGTGLFIISCLAYFFNLMSSPSWPTYAAGRGSFLLGSESDILGVFWKTFHFETTGFKGTRVVP